jgi:hypothetical protein
LRRREKVFWLVVGAIFVVGFIALIPAHGEICKESQKTGEEACISYRLVPFLVIEIGKILDALGVAITALATIAIAWFTLTLRRSTDRLWDAGNEQRLSAEGIAKRQSDDMKQSIAVANRSATVAENALIATDRAWISVKAKITGPLVFEGDQIQIDLGFNIVNVGKSPATHVRLWAELCPDIVEAKNRGNKAAEVEQMNLLDLGVVLFPGEDRKVDLPGRAMKAADFRRIIEESKIHAKERGGDWDGSLANPAVMVCVTYKLSGSRRHRHTVILYEVNHIEAAHLGWDGSEGETEPFNMTLVQTLMSGQVT